MQNDHKRPGDLASLCEWAKNRCKRNQNANFLVTGDPGTGKSGLVMMMAKAIDPGFTPERNIALRPSHVHSIAKRLKPGEVLDVDEAILAGGNKRRAMEGQNKDNLDHFATDRKLNFVRFDIMPHLSEADKALQSYSHALLQTKKQGLVEVFYPVHYGFKNLSVSWVSNFEESFPDCAAVYPEVWAEYNRLLFGELQGSGESKARRERREQYAAKIRKMAAQWSIGPGYS